MENLSAYRLLGRLCSAVAIMRWNYRLPSREYYANDVKTALIELQGACSDTDRPFVTAMIRASMDLKLGDMILLQGAERESFEEGRKDARYVMNRHPEYRSSLTDPAFDFSGLRHSEELEEEAFRKRKEINAKAKRRKSLVAVLSVCAVAFVGVLVYAYHPYFKEKRAWQELIEATDAPAKEVYFRQYVNNFPQGKHLAEAYAVPVESFMEETSYGHALRLIHEYRDTGRCPEAAAKIDSCFHVIDTIYYDSVLRPHADGNVGEALDNIAVYRSSLSDGSYLNSVDSLYEAIWSEELSAVEALNGGKRQYKEFLRGLIGYMKDARTRTIVANISTKANVREYGEYPANVRSLLESEANMTSGFSNIFDRVSLPDDMVSLKDNLSLEDSVMWKSRLTSGLKLWTDSLLTPGLISYRIGDVDEKAPSVRLTLSIVNDEYSGFPVLWKHTTRNPQSLFKVNKIMLGVSISTCAEMSYPGCDSPVTVFGSGTPGDRSEEGIGVDEVYNRLINRSIDDFNKKYYATFGWR